MPMAPPRRRNRIYRFNWQLAKRILHSRVVVVNQTDNNGWTAFLVAAEKGHDKAVEALLLARGLDINARTPTGETALILAGILGYQIIADLLIKDDRCDSN